ncbi:hypothetical protein Pcinc_015702 [Petrolisthes cinctipes]|uniref:Uncharacterized protein n=1 Tax=Petrolisthes cinctipes TaxID=88211 RepID=A0AAE1KPG5_PETCI|nr:hypothetical protein Pcinc_015702 [Petrolisthes cinctipes]
MVRCPATSSNFLTVQCSQCGTGTFDNNDRIKVIYDSLEITTPWYVHPSLRYDVHGLRFRPLAGTPPLTRDTPATTVLPSLSFLCLQSDERWYNSSGLLSLLQVASSGLTLDNQDCVFTSLEMSCFS